MKVSPEYAESVVHYFSEFVFDYDVDFRRLQDYITQWLRIGSGVEVTGGDYGNYLLAVLIIQHAYIKKPSMLDYHVDGEIRRERRPEPMIDLEKDGAGYFDRALYQQAVVFRQLKGGLR